MCSVEYLNVDFKSLATDETSFSCKLDTVYFSTLDGAEVSDGCVDVIVNIMKATDSVFYLTLKITGEVIVPCDRCLDDMQQYISTETKYLVKIGLENSEEDDVLIVSEDTPVLDLSWIVYESIALALPIKHVHAPGKCNRAMLEKLEEHSVAATRSSDGEEAEDVDPRWSKLADLKLNKELNN